MVERILEELGSDTLVRFITENLVDGFVCTDDTGTMRHVSEGFCQILDGYAPGEIVGRHFREISTGPDTEHDLALFEDVRNGTRDRYCLRKVFEGKPSRPGVPGRQIPADLTVVRYPRPVVGAQFVVLVKIVPIEPGDVTRLEVLSKAEDQAEFNHRLQSAAMSAVLHPKALAVLFLLLFGSTKAEPILRALGILN